MGATIATLAEAKRVLRRPDLIAAWAEEYAKRGRRPGRPRTLANSSRLQLMLSPTHLDRIERLGGHGNRSATIRRIIDRARSLGADHVRDKWRGHTIPATITAPAPHNVIAVVELDQLQWLRDLLPGMSTSRSFRLCIEAVDHLPPAETSPPIEDPNYPEGYAEYCRAVEAQEGRPIAEITTPLRATPARRST